MANLQKLASQVMVCAAIASAAALPGIAEATAQIGGTLSATFTSGGAACNKVASVPTTTPQDTFSLPLNAPCSTGSVTGSLRGDASTAAVGLRVVASGAGIGSAVVSLSDTWLLTPPLGTPAGTYSIPVSLQITGSASGVAALGSFLNYTMSIADFWSIGSRLDGLGSVVSAGTYTQSFNALLDVRYFGPGSALVSTLQVGVQMTVPQLSVGTVDFFNSAYAAVSLPTGWTAVTSSGHPVVSVPEPAAAVLMLLGLIGLMGAARLRPAPATPQPPLSASTTATKSPVFTP